jgi:hypothetical protein
LFKIFTSLEGERNIEVGYWKLPRCRFVSRTAKRKGNSLLDRVARLYSAPYPGGAGLQVYVGVKPGDQVETGLAKRKVDPLVIEFDSKG